jgi:hypothetical protein
MGMAHVRLPLAIARRLAPVAAGLAAALLVAGPAHAAVFAPSSVWNAPLSSSAPLASNSSSLVAGLRSQVTAYGTYINTTKYSTPVYTVSADQPLVSVAMDTTYTALKADFVSVPLPDDAVPAVGTDGHLVVYQPSTDSMWEFWRLSKQIDGWHARFGGKMTGVAANPGYFPAAVGATATSLPLVGGLMRTSELSSYSIDHALAIAIPQPRYKSYVWPAQRGDGNSTASTAIPEGTRFRLPASLNVAALNLKPALRAMVLAVQKYGMIVRDKSGSVAFFAEDPAQTGTNPYPTIFGTKWMDGNNALKGFPWDKLQAVAPTPTS